MAAPLLPPLPSWSASLGAAFSFPALLPEDAAEKLLAVLCPHSPSAALFLALTLFWFAVHAFVSPCLPSLLLPPAARRQHAQKLARLKQLEADLRQSARDAQNASTAACVDRFCAQDVGEELASLRVYRVSADANTTASLHALYLAPAALFHAVGRVILPVAHGLVAQAAAEAFSAFLLAHKGDGDRAALQTGAEDAAREAALQQERNIWSTYLAHWDRAPDYWDGANDALVIFSAYVMSSYFLWDSFECLRNLKVHRRAFLLHAVISLLGGTIQIAAPGIKLSGFCSLFAISEISTPFLHFRWFLLQNGQAERRLFRFVNALTVCLFISVRLFVVPFLVFAPYWLDLCVYRQHLGADANISSLRKVFMMMLTVGWTLLNYFWGYLFFRSLCRKRRRAGQAAQGAEKAEDPRRKAAKAD
ncbi:hypothetical protein BESB_014490 [Besnoitia besnoiti]|uniref:TLC domain-containing protein n=1 Tax=Besnoitia besnoiti TaxID=94643 RepID=A0A2A9MA81_BESBE|nr:hypothetical protein BESB_014490 [Besnoitia besnoiti]PFH32836.1 hypothetical protein BESB_014490 [Besnoitia besnoiti]